MASEIEVPAVFTAGTLSPTFQYDLLDPDDQLIGSIDGVTDGALQWSSSTTVKVGGSLDVVDVDGIDWLNARVQVWRSMGGLTWSRGIYIPSAPQDRWKDGVRSWTVEILGKLSLLDQNDLTDWVSVPAGANITDTVKGLLISAGHVKFSITDSNATLRSGMSWSPADPDVTLLRVVNDLLEAAGYWSLSVDESGSFVAEPYVLPAGRPQRYHFVDGKSCIYVDDFTREQDIYKIPNRIKGIGQATSDDPPLVSVVENNDPESRFSIVSRGMVVSFTEEGIAAADQQILDTYVRRRMVEKSSVTANYQIQHVPLPIDLNDALRFTRAAANIDTGVTVQSITEPLNAEALMTTTIREVVDL